jgi:hypothetical protein
MISRPDPSRVARKILSKFCKKCRFAELAASPKKLTNAIAREEITLPEAALLRAKQQRRHAATRQATATRMREEMHDMHARRRLIEQEMGIPHKVMAELRLNNPEQAAGIMREAATQYATLKARAKKGDRRARAALAALTTHQQ